MLTPPQVYARRVARIAFGTTLLAGAAWLVARDITDRIHPPDPYVHAVPRFDSADVLGATWIAAGVAGVVGWLIARRHPVVRAPSWLFARSLSVPFAGLALILPLSLHLLIALVISNRPGFDEWVKLSMIIAGPAHLALAIGGAVRGHQVAAGKRPWRVRFIYVGTIAVSCVPFIVLLAIPPAIVAATGLAFLPFLSAMPRIADRERLAFAGSPHELPRAVVRLRA